MLCQTIHDWLMNADDPSRPNPLVADHIAGCTLCQEFAAELIGLETAVRSHPTPPSVLANRDAFLARIANTVPPPVRNRQIGQIVAICATMAASLIVGLVTAWFIWRESSQPDHPSPNSTVAHAEPSVVEDLVEWNLRLTEADGVADRERLVRERLPELQASVRSAKLTPHDRTLAENLLSHGQRLGSTNDPVEEAEGFHELADTLLARLDSVVEDQRRSEFYARLYSKVIDRGVDANLDRAERQALKAEKQSRVQTLKKAKNKQALKAAAVAERMSGQAKEQIKANKRKEKGSSRSEK